MSVQPSIRCAACGSARVLPILYGLPGGEAMTAAQRMELVLGGCVLFADAPNIVCMDCGHRWRGPSLLRARNRSRGVDESLFDPVEHAILADWLGVPRPACARDIVLEDELDGPDDGVVRPRRGQWGDFGEFTIANAVARIALNGVQGRLPQWALVHDGKVTRGRSEDRPRPGPAVLCAQHLFTIDWATSAPGVSWPEAYHVTFLPYYDRYVVTSSRDTADICGYTDIAMGHFESGRDAVEGSREIIVAEWTRQASGGSQEKWETFCDSGLVSGGEADAWAGEVWDENEVTDPWDDPELADVAARIRDGLRRRGKGKADPSPS